MSSKITETRLNFLIKEEYQNLLWERTHQTALELLKEINGDAVHKAFIAIRRARGPAKLNQYTSRLKKMGLDDLSNLKALSGEKINAIRLMAKQFRDLPAGGGSGAAALRTKYDDIANKLDDIAKKADEAKKVKNPIAVKPKGVAPAIAAKADEAKAALKADEAVDPQIKQALDGPEPLKALEDTIKNSPKSSALVPVNQADNMALAIVDETAKAASRGVKRKMPWIAILSAAGLGAIVIALTTLDWVDPAEADDGIVDDDEETGTGGTGGGYCSRFNRILEKTIKAAGDNFVSIKMAVKDVQETLVNLGYSVKKDRSPVPFGKDGQGMVQPKQRKQYGIDGKCGPGTKAGVEDFQKFLNSKGYDLGTSGPRKDGVDGLIGPMTWAAMKKFAKSFADPSVAPENELKHPSLKRAMEQKQGDKIFQAYVRMKRLIDKSIFDVQFAAAGGAGGQYDTKDDIEDMEKTARLVSQQIGIPDLATSGRTPVGGKDKVILQAAKILDAAANDPDSFIKVAKKNGQDNMIGDPKIIQGAAKSAIIAIIDPTLKEGFEDLEFGKWSKLWK